MLPFVLVAAAAAVSARVMDSLAAVPKGWELVTKASSNDVVTLHIGLRQQRPQALEQAVIEISTPGHANYGMHMSRNEVRSYTAPSETAVSAVSLWLREHNIEHSVENDWIIFTTTALIADRLLNTTFSWFHASDPHIPNALRALSYSIPDHLAAHIDLIQPTTRFGRLSAQKSTVFEMHRLDEMHAHRLLLPTKTMLAKIDAAADTIDCSETIVPSCLQKLYNINYTASASPENKVAFASYLEEYARYQDLDLFQEAFLPQARGQNFSVEMINGGLNDQNSRSDSGEANLDLQYIHAISHPIPVVEYSTGGRGPLVPTRDQPRFPGSNEPYLEWLTYMLNMPDKDLPQTISTSYGEEEQSIPREYAVRTCNMFMQLGARGVSVIFASGDSGPGNSCTRNTDNQTYFEPTYPAGCPWVTSVGATTGVNPERAVTYSSGGFSIYHDQPAYQRAAVSGYLDSINATYAAFFNRSGRAIPDLAAQGSNFAVYDKGFLTSMSGTSAAAPVIAGIVALLNAARRTQGKPPLGFLNPWLYNNTHAFNDITTGSGVGCYGMPAVGRIARWNATAGWDPVTGLGTPKFEKLLEAAAPGIPNA